MARRRYVRSRKWGVIPRGKEMPERAPGSGGKKKNYSYLRMFIIVTRIRKLGSVWTGRVREEKEGSKREGGSIIFGERRRTGLPKR